MKTTNILVVVSLVIVGGIALMAWGWGSTNEDMAPTATPAASIQQKGDVMQNTAVMDKSTMNIVETAQSAGTFTTLIAAAQAAGLADTLATTDGITVFAPTDEAFAKLPAGTVEGLLKEPAKLAEILKYHVVAGEVPASEAMKLSSATTLEGGDLKISVVDGKVMINDATVLQADVMASNGVIHVIDTVLLPSM